MSSEKKIDFLCEKCDYPAQSEHEFMDPYDQTIVKQCPNCNSTKTKTQKIHNFRLTWDMIHEMGIDHEIKKLGDVSLRLQEYDAHSQPKQIVSVEVPEDVRREFDEKIKKAQKILQNADLYEFLKEINVRIHIQCTVVRAE
jgi:hypothetical protein